MSCGNKLKNNCGKKIYAPCVYFEGDLPLWSSLTQEMCVTIHENIVEFYQAITDLKNTLDVSNITSDCVNFPIGDINENEPIKVLLSSIVNRLEELSCEEENQDGFYKEDLDISKWDIDKSCYEDDCNQDLKSLSSLLKQITKKQCENCVEVDKISGTKVYTPENLPDIIIVDNPGNVIPITIPVDFCTTLEVKTIGNSNVSINGGQFVLADNGYLKIVSDGTNLIELIKIQD